MNISTKNKDLRSAKSAPSINRKKMYKAGRQWTIAGITLFGMGIGLANSPMNVHADVTNTTNVTAQTSQATSSSSAVKASAGTSVATSVAKHNVTAQSAATTTSTPNTNKVTNTTTASSTVKPSSTTVSSASVVSSAASKATTTTNDSVATKASSSATKAEVASSAAPKSNATSTATSSAAKPATSSAINKSSAASSSKTEVASSSAASDNAATAKMNSSSTTKASSSAASSANKKTSSSSATKASSSAVSSASSTSMASSAATNTGMSSSAVANATTSSSDASSAANKDKKATVNADINTNSNNEKNNADIAKDQNAPIIVNVPQSLSDMDIEKIKRELANKHETYKIVRSTKSVTNVASIIKDQELLKAIYNALKNGQTIGGKKYDVKNVNDVTSDMLSQVTSIKDVATKIGGGVHDFTGIDKLTGLTSLDIEGYNASFTSKITGGFTDFAKLSSHLTSLTIANVTGISSDTLANKMKINSFTKLTYLTMDSPDQSLKDLDISALSNLTQLSVSHTYITDAGLKISSALASKLSGLYLYRNFKLTQSWLDKNVSNMTNLHSFVWAWGDQGNVDGINNLKFLDKSTNLTHLEVEGSSDHTDTGTWAALNTKLTKDNLQHVIDTHSKLNYVAFNDLKNSIDGLSINSLNDLTVLRLNNDNLSKIDVSKNTKLDTLQMEYDHFTVLPDISNNKVLKTFDMANNQITNVSESYFSHSGFTWIKLNNNKISGDVMLDWSNAGPTTLDLSYNNISTFNASNSAGIKNLNLSNNNLKNLPDAGFYPFATGAGTALNEKSSTTVNAKAKDVNASTGNISVALDKLYQGATSKVSVTIKSGTQAAKYVTWDAKNKVFLINVAKMYEDGLDLSKLQALSGISIQDMSGTNLSYQSDSTINVTAPNIFAKEQINYVDQKTGKVVGTYELGIINGQSADITTRVYGQVPAHYVPVDKSIKYSSSTKPINVPVKLESEKVQVVIKDTDGNVLKTVNDTADYGSKYTGQQPKVDGYSPTSTVLSTITVGENNQPIVYVYAKTESATIHYYEIGHDGKTTTHKLANDTTTTGAKGTVISLSSTTKPKDIPGYRLVKVVGDGNVFSDKTGDVIYYYEALPEDFTVRYQDAKGNPLANAQVIHGYYNDEFNVSAAAITGYHVIKTNGKTKGVYGLTNGDVIFIYDRNDESATVTYKDQTTGKTIVVDNITGKYGDVSNYTTAQRIKELEAKGYVLVSSDFPAKGVVLNQDGKVQKFTVVFKHGTHNIDPDHPDGHKDDLTKATTQTITYVYANGKTAAKNNVQTVTYTRTGVVDNVTGAVTYSDWKAVNGVTGFKEVDSPKITGYTADKNKVAASTVSVGDKDKKYVVTYVTNDESAEIIYQDATTGEVIKTDTINGKFGQKSSYSTADEIKALTDKGYVLVSNDYPKDGAKFDQDGKVVKYTVVFKHGTHDIDPSNPEGHEDDLSRTVTETVTYVYPDGTSAGDTNKQTATFTRTGTVDEVTGKITYTDWTAKDADFKEVDSPTIEGYTPSRSKIAATTVNADSKDLNYEVDYSADDDSVHVMYVDQDGNEISDGETLNGKYGTDYTTAAKTIKGYHLVKSPANAKGKYSEEEQDVVYVYAADEGSVVVHYEDADGNEISDSTTLTGKTGSDYRAKPAKIPGYHLISIPKNTRGQFTDGSQDVIFKYAKDAPKIDDTGSKAQTPSASVAPKVQEMTYTPTQPKHVNIAQKATQTKQNNVPDYQPAKLPQTGENQNEEKAGMILGSVGVMASLTGLGVLGRRRKED